MKLFGLEGDPTDRHYDRSMKVEADARFEESKKRINKAIEVQLTAALISAVLIVGALGGLIFVAVHFIRRWW